MVISIILIEKKKYEEKFKDIEDKLANKKKYG